MGRSWTPPGSIDNRVRFLNEIQTATNTYLQKLVWRFSYDTGTASYTNPIMILSSQNGVGVGASDQTALSYFRAGNQSSVDLFYTLPTGYPSGTGTSYLSASTAGVMAWVAAPTGGSATPAGSNKQIQYNNSTAFGGASGAGGVSGAITGAGTASEGERQQGAIEKAIMGFPKNNLMFFLGILVLPPRAGIIQMLGIKFIYD